MSRSANMHFSYLLLADEALGHGDIYQKKQGIINKSGIHAYTKQLISDNDHTGCRSVVGQEHYFFSFSQIMHEYFVKI